ncbi:hypothetical protein FGU71_07130 [Erythrobacter insulae]|uniref:Lipopolysaccharide biosynthesis protein n=1 Tax=Erythrobacter insulae TaxID=2584124 RepID=A0A547PBZ5_9SPHN|nr:oligosaccharide flippase family protein [Erythrobacter insulae]TRD11661.1 hypothetical protein FGU71_07130 [Erythrobacter insulae]
MTARDQHETGSSWPATNVRRMVNENSDVLLSLAVRGATVLAGFAVTYLIGHNLGAAATGQFALVSQTAMILSVIGLFGLDVSVVRHFSKTVADKTSVAFSAFAKVLASGFGLMCILVMVLWLGGEHIWEPLFGIAVPLEMLGVLCALLVARGGVQLLGALLRSQHSFTLGQIISALAIPLATSLALVSGIAATVYEALWAAALAGLIAAAFGVGAMMRYISRRTDAAQIGMRTVFATSLPLWGVGIAQNIGDWYGLAVSAQMFGTVDAGLYRVSVQIAGALQIVSLAIFAVYSAKISAAFHADDRKLAARLARAALIISSLTAAPLVIILLFGGEFLLAQIGPEFVAAWPILAVLLIGQLALILTGPSGMILAMSGNERANLWITITSTLTLLLILPIAAHAGGLLGIAICVPCVMLLRNLAAYVTVLRKERINIWTGQVISPRI